MESLNSKNKNVKGVKDFKKFYLREIFSLRDEFDDNLRVSLMFGTNCLSI